MKLKLKGRRFDTIEEIQAESQRVLDALIEKTFKKRSKNGGDGGTGVYIMGPVSTLWDRCLHYGTGVYIMGPVSTCGMELLRE